jgi:peptide-methionine (R)-S-oxide reductase
MLFRGDNIIGFCQQSGYMVMSFLYRGGRIYITYTDGGNMNDEQYQEKLTSEQYQVTRLKATEPAFTGALLHNKEKGTYSCICCGTQLFSSDTKFDSGSGWPSFWDEVDDANIIQEEDVSYGMHRIEVMCSTCGAHLGHLFPDGPQPTGLRYCINSLSLGFRAD